MNFRQSDNICTVNWRNVHSQFTVEQLFTIQKHFPDAQYSATFCPNGYVNVNSPEKLQKYIDTMIENKLRPFPTYGYYIDYHTKHHDDMIALLQSL